MKINAAAEGFKPDRTDRAILRQLQRDTSISNVALAAKVNLSAPACLLHVERLREAGLIRATVALLNPKALDAGMLVLIGVMFDRATPESFTAFEKVAQKVPGCMACHVVTGEFDFFMLIRTRDSDSFNRLHAEKLFYLPGVCQIRTFVVLREFFRRPHFPFDSDIVSFHSSGCTLQIA
ncbi:Leucine-responsive regulatory protein [Candidatus Burkholderia pumila]|uniref:Leucine-responsive regulatory protein n=1 Tax=Candidatus Burkholderia pumila TaxID=1090375 RepID=A0ABR5HP57_9BURK|nr:Leucine-responsive regulatory protein [Candidatus Burkholderia pumila]